ncbi:MAG: GTPase [Verrucomicrobiota bacterium]
MNRTALLHIVERLEGLLGKLPGAIQKPVLRELTPLKELFLQQRSPRFLLAGAGRLPMPQIVNLLFNGEASAGSPHILSEVFCWQTFEVKNRGTIALLDARGADDDGEDSIREELNRQSADAILVVSDAAEGRTKVKRSAENGNQSVYWNDRVHPHAGIIAIHLNPPSPTNRSGRGRAIDWMEKIKPELHGRFWGGFEFSVENGSPVADHNASQQFLSLLAKRLPNDCRVEIVRISNDREAQREIASVLIKSTSAICTAIGAQPIPLADLPILTTLQLVMVSGIMYLSGRPRSLRAATEFVGALGANVGAGMLLREGARALLKFIPGWGNVVCGMVAGAGTYAIGQAASAYFLEGVTLGEARRTYLKGRKRKKPPILQLP